MGVAYQDAMFSQIRQRLESEMARVREEIRRYPAPIPACDAQFNHLLELRESLSSALARLRKLEANNAGSEGAAFIEAFLDSSYDLGDTVRSEIRSIIENETRDVGGSQ